MKAILYRFGCALFLFSLLSTTQGRAQVVRIDSTALWKKAFRVGLNLNQASFSSNWKAGGVNSLGFNTFLTFKAAYKKDNNTWDNDIDMQYGMVNNQGQGYRKTLDRMFIDSKYGRTLNAKWNFAASFNFLSQFAKGYKYDKDAAGLEVASLISDAFAPAFITTGLGFEYRPVDYFKVRISPFAPRVTIVSDVNRFVTADNPTPYGVEPPDKARFEWLAAQIMAEFAKDIALTAKVNQFINVSLGGIVLYDYDQDHSVQLSQAFSLGVLYTFQNYKE
jgi:hypothetical protein